MSRSVPADPLPSVFVPGLACTPRLYAGQVALAVELQARYRSPTTRATTPCRPSPGASSRRRPRGFLPWSGSPWAATWRSRNPAPSPGACRKLCLLDTTARPDTPEQTERRKAQIALAEGGRYAEVPDMLFPKLVHKEHLSDEGLRAAVRQMAEQVGAAAFVRQQKAMMCTRIRVPGSPPSAVPRWSAWAKGTSSRRRT